MWRRARYQFVLEHLQRTGSLQLYLSTAKVYAQGSRAIGATIIDGATDDRFDLGAILEFAPPRERARGKVLDELHPAFEGFPDAKRIKRCTRCVQLQLQSRLMHLDVTPMYPAPEPRAERVGAIYHSPDTGIDARLPVNPGGSGGRLTLPSQPIIDAAHAMRARLEIKDPLVAGLIVADADVDDQPDLIDPVRDLPRSSL